MKMYTGDLLPVLEITLSADDPVDLTLADSILIIGRLNNKQTPLFSRAPSTQNVVGDTTVLTMNWQVGDTVKAGEIKLEVEVLWPGDKPQTFRVEDCVQIFEDYGGTA